jgi:maleate cis-trans isomerase
MAHHFGVLIPSTNTTVEIEYTRLLPEGLQAHYGRLGKEGDTPFHPSKTADVIYQSKMLGDAKVAAIALAQTSASLFSDDYDDVTTRQMAEGAKAPAITSAVAIGQALAALGLRRIAVVTPYAKDALARAKAYFETRHGLEVVAAQGFDAADAYMIGKLGPEHARAAFDRIDTPAIEAFVVPGGNFPTMRFVPEWEAAFGKPVITTNGAVVWAVAAMMKADVRLPGLGRLLEQMPKRA